MNLEKEKLKALVKISTNQNTRFEKLNKLFDEIDEKNAEVKGNELLIDNATSKKEKWSITNYIIFWTGTRLFD